MKDNRAGTFISSGSGYDYFSPKKLPPTPPIRMDPELSFMLSTADLKLGRLDGVTHILPNPELFVAMYVRKEALLSSQIEGTQASLIDILDADNVNDEKRENVGEVVNYVNAMNYGLKRLENFPLSLRLLKDIHSVLLAKGRGSERNPGEFRKTQNWIGPAGCTLTEAIFVPPTVPVMLESIGELEKFFYSDTLIPPLIKIALIHAQFESIHPFLDGNGRMGRLLITFWLCREEILSQPLLYLSYYFKAHRSDYYDSLMSVRLNGDWESWIKFFLKGVSETSDEAIKTAKDIIALKEKCEEKISETTVTQSKKLLDMLFEQPFVSRPEISDALSISSPTAGRLVEEFVQKGILVDATPNRVRYKKYKFKDYIDILSRNT